MTYVQLREVILLSTIELLDGLCASIKGVSDPFGPDVPTRIVSYMRLVDDLCNCEYESVGEEAFPDISESQLYEVNRHILYGVRRFLQARTYTRSEIPSGPFFKFLCDPTPCPETEDLKYYRAYLIDYFEPNLRRMRRLARDGLRGKKIGYDYLMEVDNLIYCPPMLRAVSSIMASFYRIRNYS